jgi:hypothetical protein
VFLGELPPQRLEIRQAGLTDHGRFAVDDQLSRRKRLGCACDLAVLLGPVIAAAGEHPDPAGVDMQLRAVAIDLDLVQPVGPLGGALAQGRVAGRDEPGIGCGLGAGEGEAAAAPERTPQRDGTHAGSMGPRGAGSQRPRRVDAVGAHKEMMATLAHRGIAWLHAPSISGTIIVSAAYFHGVQLSAWSSSMSRARIVALSFVAALALSSGALAQGGG